MVRPDLRAWHLVLEHGARSTHICSVHVHGGWHATPVRSTCTVTAGPHLPWLQGLLCGAAPRRPWAEPLPVMPLRAAGCAVRHLHNSVWLLSGGMGGLLAQTLCRR